MELSNRNPVLQSKGQHNHQVDIWDQNSVPFPEIQASDLRYMQLLVFLTCTIIIMFELTKWYRLQASSCKGYL